MVQLGGVIELESSPEPASPSHRRLASTKSRDKGKGRATPNRLGLAKPSRVIELTDSDSSTTPSVPLSSKTTTFIANLNPYTPKSTKSFDNIPTPSLASGSPSGAGPSFALASGSGAGSSSAVASGSGTRVGAVSPGFDTRTAGPSTQKFNVTLPTDEEQELPASLPATVHIAPVEDDAPVVNGQEPIISVSVPDPQPQAPAQASLQPPTPDPAIADLDQIPIETMDPTSTAVAQILEIIPNVEPTHLLQLIETHLPAFSMNHHNVAAGEDAEAEAAEAKREATIEEQVQGVVGHVLHLLFENPDYPKAVSGKGKGKRVADDERDLGGNGKGKGKETPAKKPKIDYASVDRPFPGGPNYFDLALYHLQTSFPRIPKPYLRRQLQNHKSLYAPTHLSILAAEKAFAENEQNIRPYGLKSIVATLRKPQDDVAFEEEKAWLDAELVDGGNAKGGNVTMDDVDENVVMDNADDGEDDGTGIECQCCFGDYPFSKMVQCPEAHLFCSTCISTYAATQLGAHNSSLACIHPSSCSLPFPPSELKRILSVKLYELYERLEQQKEIMQAGLVGLEECPFCEWKCVLEASTEEDKLFRCGNEEGGCGVVSCRGCKKLDHLPKSCKEVEEDRHLDGRHAIEEAMTRALMRNCPKCQKAFIKEQGCNKMSCPNCHTLSCYICRKVINGYDHFNQLPGNPSTSANAKKCLLWDTVEERHAREVKEAAEKAIEEYKRDHPDVDESAIKVDLPEAPVKNVVPAGVHPHMPIMYHGLPMMHHPIPNPNPIVGHHPHLLVAPPPRYMRHQPQPVAHQRQPARQPLPVTRARAAAIEQQQVRARAQQQAAAVANVKTQQAHLAARLAEVDNLHRQRLDRGRDQRAAARMEQQERARLEMELERQGRGQPQMLPHLQGQMLHHLQGQMRLQGPAQPQAQGQARQEPYHHHVFHHHHHQPPPPPQQQLPIHNLPVLQQNPFALPAYPAGIQQQHQPMMAPPPPQFAENLPHLKKGRGRRRR